MVSISCLGLKDMGKDLILVRLRNLEPILRFRKTNSVMTSLKREIVCADSLKWMAGKRFGAIFTSLPDLSELDCTLPEYLSLIRNAGTVLAQAVKEDGCVIFYQTDRRFDGALISKDFLLSEVFYQQGFKRIFHKIVLRKEPGKIDLYRPGYSNMFCFSKRLRAGRPTADVIYTGEMLHPGGVGLNACDIAIDYIRKSVKTDTILDPFCGVGTIPAAANKHGYHAIGIDINPERVTMAKTLQIVPNHVLK